MTSFSDLELAPKVLQAVEEAGYTTPTPIQAEAIPHALLGKDVLGIAQTGTGKTASFTLPMITLLSKGRARARMPRSLVLAPTRELATQVAENFKVYSKHTKLTMALLIGGTSFKDQDRLIDRGVDVLIATPGRLLDHHERGKLMLTGVQIMVVDEADRMLDMGFIPDIERIFKLTPFTRQTLFFSATMAPEITRITQEFLSNPVRVEVARQATTSETIKQFICKHTPSRKDRSDSEKREILRQLIEAEGDKLTNGMIFCNRKRDVDIVAKSLKKHGLDAAPIHGDLDQSVRTRTLDGFREGKLRLLIASDVAARGLDIPSVSHVFNYDIPTHSEDYVHRIGRTGRAGREGKAITLCLPHEQKYLSAIEDLVKKSIPLIDSPLAKKSTVDVKDDPKDAEPKPAPSRRKPTPRKAETTKVAASENPTPAKAPAHSPQARAPQPRTQQRRSGNRVVGMGDHVPAFILHAFSVEELLASDRDVEEAPEVDVVEEIATEDTPVVAEEKPKTRKPRVRKPRAKKPVEKTDAVEVEVKKDEATAPDTPVETPEKDTAEVAAPALEAKAPDAKPEVAKAEVAKDPVEAPAVRTGPKPRKRVSAKSIIENIG